MQGFLLGLAVGPTCLAYCAPVLVPYLLGEGRGIRQNTLVLGQFLGGRLVGYLLFGLLAWIANLVLLQGSSIRELIFGAIYIVLAAALAVYGLLNPPNICAGKSLRGRLSALLTRWPALVPLALGFLTGLNLCPPFLLAVTEAANAGSAWGSVLFFCAFFLGTAVYFVPTPLLGALSRWPALKIIGKLAAVVMAAYYAYMGLILIGGGIVKL